ncbi:MAG: PKD domain-containing protein [Chitinophagaceae bacterium]
MRKLFSILSIIAILWSFVPADTTYNITTTVLTGDYARPGAGNERWNENSGSQIVTGAPAQLDYYRRFTIKDIEGDIAGSYDFTKFDQKLHAAMDARQKFSFGIMQQFPWGDGNFNWLSNFTGTDQRTGTSKNGNSAYPLSWHTSMQGETIKDWIGDSGDWVPNFNSSLYLTKWNALHAAINSHLQSGSYQPSWAASPIPYKDVIGYIDIRGFGSWGEWHVYGTAPGNNYNNFPAGTYPTVNTFKGIVNAQVNNYQDFRLVIITNALDAARLGNTGTPAEVAAYIYTRTTNKGFVGFRMDHFGDHTGDNELADDSYDDYQLQKNSASFAGFRLDTAFNNRYRLAPFYGEPPGGPTSSFGIVQGVFPRQVRKWRVAMVGNGNFGQGNTPTGQAADSVKQGYREAGYHLRITGGNVIVGSQLTTNVKWRNYGLTPTYEHWTVQYSLRNGAGTTVWTSNSAFDPYLFLPDYGELTKTDVFALPGIAAGNYSLYVTIKDPVGYRLPLPLQITGRDANGSYLLTNITIPTGTANRPPVSNAGPNQTIIAPDNDVVLSGSLSSDPDGTLATYLWSQVSGPSTATITPNNTSGTTVSGLMPGNYTFRLTVTDNNSATSTDDVTITVSPNLVPVAEAGNNQSITLPDDDVVVSGSATDDGTIVSYRWDYVSGPNKWYFSNQFGATTTIDSLLAGTYRFKLTVTDNGGLTDTDTVTITVAAGNQAPVSNPGSPQTIQLPLDSATVSGSGSTDDGTITLYAWTQSSGPNTANIISPSSVNTKIKSLIAGVYSFQLTVSDGSLTNSRTVQITVLAVPNLAPVSVATAQYYEMTLPLDSSNLLSTGSNDDNGITGYAWTQIGGPTTATIVNATSSTAKAKNLQPGIYIFRLTVSDGSLTNADEVTITVSAAAILHQRYRWKRKYVNH